MFDQKAGKLAPGSDDLPKIVAAIHNVLPQRPEASWLIGGYPDELLEEAIKSSSLGSSGPPGWDHGSTPQSVVEHHAHSYGREDEAMSTVEEIEAAIEVLPREQFFRLLSWIRERFEEEWDRQIEEDAKAGRLDAFAREALAEYRAGRTRPFPPDE